MVVRKQKKNVKTIPVDATSTDKHNSVHSSFIFRRTAVVICRGFTAERTSESTKVTHTFNNRGGTSWRSVRTLRPIGLMTLPAVAADVEYVTGTINRRRVRAANVILVFSLYRIRRYKIVVFAVNFFSRSIPAMVARISTRNLVEAHGGGGDSSIGFFFLFIIIVISKK